MCFACGGFLFHIMSSIHHIPAEHDPMGAAIHDYYMRGRASRLRVFSPQFDEDEIPVSTLFRTYAQMPALEQKALDMAQGRILDVGAGAGCHSLVLQERGQHVEAIDISPLSVETMQARGVKSVRQADFFSLVEQYDTILMLMNGSGIVGRVEHLPRFFQHLARILAPGGQVLMDSSDLRYIFEDEEDNLDWDPQDGYYGEVTFRMQYRSVRGEEFPWLYLDFASLQLYAEAAGFHVDCVERGNHYDYLARIYR